MLSIFYMFNYHSCVFYLWNGYSNLLIFFIFSCLIFLLLSFDISLYILNVSLFNSAFPTVKMLKSFK